LSEAKCGSLDERRMTTALKLLAFLVWLRSAKMHEGPSGVLLGSFCQNGVAGRGKKSLVNEYIPIRSPH
jgi:hypothetical protein